MRVEESFLDFILFFNFFFKFLFRVLLMDALRYLLIDNFKKVLVPLLWEI